MSRKTIDRRAMLAIGAALPAPATSQALAISSSWGTAPDPIFAAIETHRAACSVYSGAVDVSAALRMAPLNMAPPRP